ncbi:hypothetical protein HPB51_014139 [Rhipicephalus microplus]|uniref:UBX domain-containing protein 4 n=1 Tax=Rhipicephalus microplus TaxID=6941 RepID=A0A9J6E2D5_RHIMP|nr:hypothetical protein HPB51_014139 [Rhipicephalus microplus]
MDEMARTASRRTLLTPGGRPRGVAEQPVPHAQRRGRPHHLSQRRWCSRTPTSPRNIVLSEKKYISAPKAQAKAAQDSDETTAAPAGLPGKQRVHVTISDQKADGVKDEAKANASETAVASTNACHRVSLSGTNVRNLFRNRPSASRLAVNGGRSPSAQASQTSGVGNNVGRSASYTPLAIRGCGGALCGADKANIVLNLPDGSSVLRSFPASAYLDEVRWYTEELLARVLPTCFPFTMARTNPLREFSREDYRKTLEQLHLVPSAALLVLPRSAAMGESGAPSLLRSGEPVWLSIFRLVFGTFVATPLSLIWSLIYPESDQALAVARETFLSGSLGTSTLSALPPSTAATAATPLRSASSGRLCRRRQSSRTDNFDIF